MLFFDSNGHSLHQGLAMIASRADVEFHLN